MKQTNNIWVLILLGCAIILQADLEADEQAAVPANQFSGNPMAFVNDNTWPGWHRDWDTAVSVARTSEVPIFAV